MLRVQPRNTAKYELFPWSNRQNQAFNDLKTANEEARKRRNVSRVHIQA